MLQRFETLICLMVLSASVMWSTAPYAAEYSSAKSLGFTQDGNHFVFEEFGSQDGLGLPYVNLFVINIAKDRWVKGTPIRLIGTEEEAIALEEKLSKQGITDPVEIDASINNSVTQKRQQALVLAQPTLDQLGPLSPAELRAHNPPQEFTTNSKQVRFSAVNYRNLINTNDPKNLWKLELREIGFAATEDCFGIYDSMKGFELVLINEENGAETVLNNDTRVPKSRSCPQKYYIEQVLTYRRSGTSFSLAVLVRYARPGFEGPDGRLLAITAIITP